MTITNGDPPQPARMRYDLFKVRSQDDARAIAIDISDSRIERSGREVAARVRNRLQTGELRRSNQHVAIDPGVELFVRGRRDYGLTRIIDPLELRRFAVGAELLHFAIDKSAEASGILQLREHH